MEKAPTYHKTVHQLNVYLAVLLAFSLPFPRQFSLYVSVLWILFSILDGLLNKRFFMPRQYRLLVLAFLLFYFLHGTGLLYSNNTQTAWIDIVLKIPFAILPLVLALSSDNLAGLRNKILVAFVAGNIVASVVCLAAAIARSLSYADGQWHWQAELMEHYGYTFWQMLANGGNNFMYEALSIFIHPGYFSIFLVVSVVILMDILNRKEHKLSWKASVGLVLLVIFCSIMVYLLFSRTGLISLFLVLFVYFLIFVLKLKNKILKLAMLLFIVIFVVAGGFVFSQNGRMKNTYVQLKKFLANPSDVSKNDDRLFIWGLSLDIIKENPIFGVGTGDSKDELMIKYEENQMEDALKARLNVHNQFLETTIQLGLAGLMSLMLIFFWSFAMAIRKHNTMLALVLSVNALFLLFESVLNTQTGVYYFVFVISALLFVPQGKANNEITFS